MEAEPDSPLYLVVSLFFSLLSVPLPEVIIGSVLIIILLMCSALVSGSEVAFFSLTYNDFEKLAQEGEGASAKIIQLADKPRALLATILISNNFINIAIVILSDFVLKRIFPTETFLHWANSFVEFSGINFDVDWLANVIGFSITVVGVTFLLVLFGEVSPKFYATLNKIRLAKLMASPLTFLSWFFWACEQNFSQLDKGH